MSCKGEHYTCPCTLIDMHYCYYMNCGVLLVDKFLLVPNLALLVPKLYIIQSQKVRISFLGK